MQFKGLIKFFTVVLILISLYQLSFTFVVHHHENQVAKQATAFIDQRFQTPQQKYPGNPEMQAFYQDSLSALIKDKEKSIEDSTANNIIYNTLIKQYTYGQAKGQELRLGLDLQGGMNVVLQISLEDLIRSMASHSRDPAFNRALQLATQRKTTSSVDYITLFGQAYQEIAPQGRLAPIFSNAFQSKINYNSTNAEVLNVIRAASTDAIKNTYTVLQQRIDKFGVSQPVINLDLNKDIISVELAGVTNEQRVRQYLQATAKLEFWETYQPDQDFALNVLQPMNEAAARYLAGAPDTSGQQDTSKAKPSSTIAKTKAVHTKKDTSKLGTLGQYLTQTPGQTPGRPATGISGAQFQASKQNPLSILKSPMIGGAIGSILASDTAKFNYYLSLPTVRNVMPKTLKFLYGTAPTGTNSNPQLDVYAIKTIAGSTEAPLGGEHVVDAGEDVSQDGRPEITMTMDNEGARIWAKLTAANVGKPIAIVLDNTVYSAPAPKEEITGGRSSITGNFTIQQAQDLANILKTGKLPAPARIVQEQVIGPTLGKESIAAGAKSFIIAFIVIFLLMLAYYSNSGWVANIALIFNLLFTVGVLAALGATLTMPGIAGLVLTIGMAVDTNVIIFERIKEEIVKGKGYMQSIADGYRHSYSPVLDAHVTTLLTAIILFYFGLGPVRGFATTQILGILLSLFCGILISRLVEDYFTDKKKHLHYFTKISRRIFQHANFKFIEARKYTYVISGIVMALGISSFFHGFNYGVEFRGGRSYTIRFNHPVKVEDIRQTLHPLLKEYPVVKTIGNFNQVNITTSYLITKSGKNTDSLVEAALFRGLHKFLPAGTNYHTFDTHYKLQSQTVLPTISDALKKGAVKATIFAMIAIFLYILFRFRKWQYSLGTILSLIHDVLVTLAVFSYLKDLGFDLEINQNFIAAILTVIGYSMNDTIIVFDRIREYFREMKGASKITVINKAINDTLSRTIMTSLTVFLTLLILFVFGGETTRGFAFAMLIGVITGTYSSIFIASPVLIDLDRSNDLGPSDRRTGLVTAPVKSGTSLGPKK
ncbi:MAG TPA: protein translocase subunit SecDF [Chitinophagaceae bacterium]|nr:protein translocase subunit SecDF [Chitinophagaceae bacterium]